MLFTFCTLDGRNDKNLDFGLLSDAHKNLWIVGIKYQFLVVAVVIAAVVHWSYFS